MSPLRAFSSGGGVQSTAALVLSAQGRIAIGAAQEALFSDEDGWGGECDEGTCFV